MTGRCAAFNFSVAVHEHIGTVDSSAARRGARAETGSNGTLLARL
jgi:hypothetical protein